MILTSAKWFILIGMWYVIEWTNIKNSIQLIFFVSILFVFLSRALWQFLTLSSLILIKIYLTMLEIVEFGQL